LLFVFPINIDCYCCPIPFAFSDMTNQRIIYSNTNGTVSVIIPTGELSIEEVAAKDVPTGLTYEIVTTDEVPSDRTFRAAWVMGNCCIDHDLNKCEMIGHDQTPCCPCC
jgi:hypothetical protein